MNLSTSSIFRFCTRYPSKSRVSTNAVVLFCLQNSHWRFLLALTTISAASPRRDPTRGNPAMRDQNVRPRCQGNLAYYVVENESAKHVLFMSRLRDLNGQQNIDSTSLILPNTVAATSKVRVNVQVQVLCKKYDSKK